MEYPKRIGHSNGWLSQKFTIFKWNGRGKRKGPDTWWVSQNGSILKSEIEAAKRIGHGTL